MPPRRSVTITAAWIGILGVILLALATLGVPFIEHWLNQAPIPTSTNNVQPTVISSGQTPSEISTLTMTPLSTEDVLIGLIDNYYQCINQAQHGHFGDYEKCWNLLSDQPGEFQDINNQSNGGNGLDVYFNYWNDRKLGYALYFCQTSSEEFVEAEYYLYKWNDNSMPLDNKKSFRRYSFGSDQNGWRIKNVDTRITQTDTYCDQNPRVEKWTPNP